MRPLRLQIDGLRSYRHYQDIPLDKEGLIAIVGDTGAGKSSILEAITYALYSATSWDQRNVRALISDGAKKVSVVFDFTAEGKRWRVTRSTGSAQPVHLLECIDDPLDPRARVDGEDAVNRAIEKVVGLNYDAFQSAVVLSQGRFQHLLTSRPGDRTAILKGILRLDELEVVRGLADDVQSRLRPTLVQRQNERQAYYPNPCDVAENARLRRLEAGRVAGQLKLTRDAVAEQQAQITSGQRDSEQLTKERSSLQSAVIGKAEALSVLVAIEREVRTQLIATEENLAIIAEREQVASRQLDETSARGVGLGDLRAAVVVVGRLVEDVRRLVDKHQDLSALEARHREFVQLAAGDQTRLDELKLTLDQAEQVKSWAAEAQLQIGNKREAAIRALASCRTSVAAAAEAVNAEVLALRGLENARSEQQRTREVAEVARVAVSETEQRLALIQHSNAAAHAAHGAAPGEPCPVCTRPLPDGFVPPTQLDENPATELLAAARTQSRKADRTEAMADAALGTAEGAREAADRAAKAAEESADTAAATARVLLDADDLGGPDADLLGALDQAVSAAALAFAQADNGVTTAHAGAVAHMTEMGARKRDVEAAELAARNATLEVESIAKRMEADRVSIPEDYRPVTPLSVEALEAAGQAITARANELRVIDDQRKDAAEKRAALERQREALRGRLRAEVDEPAARAAQPLANLHIRLCESAPAVGADAPAELRDAATLAERADWATALEAQALAVADLLAVAIAAAEQRISVASAIRTEKLGAAGFESDEALDEAFTNATADVVASTREEAEALRQVPLAADLDARIKPAEALLQDLVDLAGLLSDAKFVRFVVAKKQRALLGVASEILGQMTTAHYGFAEDFQIIDRISGQPRDAKTLSGGETFLASLALALGLVEIAGRSGGRLEALFLDEGFGSLDSTTLDDALSMLERVAGSGRLVAVVSHLRAVAERIENVLYVKRRDEDRSSQAEWIGPAERDTLVEQDMERGLLV